MGPAKAIGSCLSKSFDFSGRAARSEFWWFVGFTLLLGLVTLLMIDIPLFGFDPRTQNGNAPASTLAGLAILPATLSVFVRRMQDRGLVGWPAAAIFVASAVLSVALRRLPGMYTPATSTIDLVVTGLLIAVLLIALLPGTPGPNRYGPAPKEVTP